MRSKIIVLVIILLIICIYSLSTFKENFSNDIIKKILIVDSEKAMGYGGTALEIGGDSEMKIYRREMIPVLGAGAVGGQRGLSLVGPKTGFDVEETKNNGFDDTIVSKNNIQYVSNNLMVPHLFQMVKANTAQIKILNEQITSLGTLIRSIQSDIERKRGKR